MRRIVLLRHAKAVRPDQGLSDFDRPLDARGRDEAPRAGQLLADVAVTPDIALVSAALRTRQTWDLIADLVPARTVIVESDLYLADAETWLDHLSAHADAETVLGVGHNPGLKDAADVLMGPSGHDTRARASLAAGLPTSCAVILSLDGAPAPGVARLAAFLAPARESDPD